MMQHYNSIIFTWLNHPTQVATCTAETVLPNSGKMSERPPAASKPYRFPRSREEKLDDNWLYFGGGLFGFSQVLLGSDVSQ